MTQAFHLVFAALAAYAAAGAFAATRAPRMDLAQRRRTDARAAPEEKAPVSDAGA